MLGFAHRGGMAEAPENSLAAFRNALARGVDGLESDVWLDRTGEPVLHHGPPHQEREPPLALAALFGECGTGFDLSLDVNGPGTAERAVAIARDGGFDLSRLWLCGGTRSCAEWRELDPQLRLVTDLRRRDALLYAEPTLRALAAQGVDAVNLRHSRWTRQLVRRVQAAGLRAFAWDVQSHCGLRRALQRGVDAVYSDHPGLLVDGLAR